MKSLSTIVIRGNPFLTCWSSLLLVCGLFAPTGHLIAAAPRAAEVIKAQGPLSDPANRARAVEEMRVGENERQTAARSRALQQGLPLRGKLPDGGVFELVEFNGDDPIYRKTCNANAAISINANVIRAAPYNANGTGGTVGLWDASSARTTHQEFGGRVTTMDGSAATEDHSSHVAGTLCAVGITSAARGMATNAWVGSYDWNNDFSEMTGRGASTGGESGKINVSSHSYGITSGWAYTGGTPLWIWYGSGTTAAGYENDFGMYNTYSRDVDSIAYSLPYYLIFWAASNERNNNPTLGQSVALNPQLPSVTVAYDPALHPPGDGTYRNGYDTISFCALAKNVVTVGAVNDAQNGGSRYLPWATMTDFSSWGPTDDGRIKPDVVANGYYVYSCLASSDSAYGYMSGTSMATPSVAGLAQQLVGYYGSRFPGQAMRSSTLKGLLIHTADDLGTPGPDYSFGWGLVNGKAAADLIASVATNPLTPRLIENQLTTSVQTRTHTFNWDGISPIRATLCWTDPAGTATTTSDSRTARLVNDLNLRLVSPAGTQHFPYVMPFVGTWTIESMPTAATTGTNKTDNVEQVFIAAPSVAGTYQAVISYSGTLSNSQQAYALLISGSAPPPPTLQSVIPNSAASGLTSVTIKGEAFAPGATVTFLKSGYSDVTASISSLTATSIVCSVDVTGMAVGAWDVRVINPDSKTGTLASAFTVLLPVVSDISPARAEAGAITFTVTGQNFVTGSSLAFVHDAKPPVSANLTGVTSTTITGTLDGNAMAQGLWGIQVTNPGNKVSNTNVILTLVRTLAIQNFDPDAPGWTTSVTLGTGASAWQLSSAASHTPANSYWIAPPASKKTDNLISEGFAISPEAQSLRFHFWHKYYTETYDGGVLEISSDNGTNWYGIAATGSGTAFVSGGYTATIGSKAGRTKAELYGSYAWRGNSGTAFTEVVVSLDPAVFAGKTLRARWRMSTDSANSTGTWYWYVDSVRITGYAPYAKGTVLWAF